MSAVAWESARSLRTRSPKEPLASWAPAATSHSFSDNSRRLIVFFKSDRSSSWFPPKPRSASIYETWCTIDLRKTTNRAAVGDGVALAAAPQIIRLDLAIAAEYSLAIAGVAVDEIWRVAICIQNYGICILWDETNNVRMPPDEIADFLIHGTVRYWTSLSPH